MSTSYETKTIEHLGLVAGMYDELGGGEVVAWFQPLEVQAEVVTEGLAIMVQGVTTAHACIVVLMGVKAKKEALLER